MKRKYILISFIHKLIATLNNTHTTTSHSYTFSHINYTVQH